MATRALTLARRLVWLCLAARFAPCSTAPLGPDARAPATPAAAAKPPGGPSLAHDATRAEMPYVLLSNGVRMPKVGLGTAYHTSASIVPNLVQWLQAGGRHIDGAYCYKDQLGVGQAIRQSGVPRADMFLVSKTPSGGGGPDAKGSAVLGYEETLALFNTSLAQLNQSYVDLFLMHWPEDTMPFNHVAPACRHGQPDWRFCRSESWRALEAVYREGRTRAIGVSNYEARTLDEMVGEGGYAKVPPMVNQIEFHVGYHEDALWEYCRKHGIALTAYSPLAEGAPLLCANNASAAPTLLAAAQKHGMSTAEAALRFILQHEGFTAIPRVSSLPHMLEDMAAAGGDGKALSAADMKALGLLGAPSRTGRDPVTIMCVDPDTGRMFRCPGTGF